MRTNESLKEHRTKLVTWGKKKENPTATRIKDEFDKRNIGSQIIIQKKQLLHLQQRLHFHLQLQKLHTLQQMASLKV